MPVANSFRAGLAQASSPSAGATETLNITDSVVNLRTVGTVPADIAGVTYYVSSINPDTGNVLINNVPYNVGESVAYGYGTESEVPGDDLANGLVNDSTFQASVGATATIFVSYFTKDLSPVTGVKTINLLGFGTQVVGFGTQVAGFVN